jgi:pimeloyl-ACP methyl ester carboxylesterase
MVYLNMVYLGVWDHRPHGEGAVLADARPAQPGGTMNDPSIPVRCPGRAAAWLLVVWIALAGSAAVAQAQPAAVPPGYGPVSVSLEDVAYPFPVQYMPLVLYGEDVRMAYMDIAPAGGPNGRSVVLLHGLNFFGEYWGSTIEALRDQGFRVVAVDQIGFGRSSKPVIPYTLGDHAANTRQLLEHLGIGEAAVVGHSFGGMLATRFALFYPEVTTHLAVVNQIGLTDARLERPWRYTDEVYREELARDYASIRSTFERYYVEWRPEFERHIRIHYGWTQSPDWPRLAMIRALNRQVIFAEPVVYDWPHIRPRTLVIGGEVDGPDFPALARNVAETIPNAELVLFPNVGHNPHLEAPELFQPALIRFLRSDPLPREGGP